MRVSMIALLMNIVIHMITIRVRLHLIRVRVRLNIRLRIRIIMHDGSRMLF